MPAIIHETRFNDQPVLALATPGGARAVVAPFGAQVLSWTPAGGDERLYLSEAARFDGKTPIRGGIPVCFPQFAEQGKLPRHGFARNLNWTVRERREGDRFALVTLGLNESDTTLALWPNAFDVELTLVVEDDRLDVELEIENTGYAPFAFTAALHTYLRVREVEHCRLSGLSGHDYRDKTDGGRIKRDQAEALTVDDAVDRIYHDVAGPLLLQDSGRHVKIVAEGFPDTVVWNPWETGCREIDDLPKLGFRNMLCVEAAAARTKVQLDAGQTWSGRQTLIAL